MIEFKDNPGTHPSEKWMNYFFNIAKAVSTGSKDPSTKVGCIAVDPISNRLLATGYNGFPPKVQDLSERLNTRETRYIYTVHAEANCISAAARFGISIEGCDLYVTLHPCVDCAKLVASTGIKRIFFIDDGSDKRRDDTWRKLLCHAKTIFEEAGIGLYACREVYEKPAPKQEAPEKHKTWKGCVDKWEDLSTKRNVQIGDLIFVKHNNTLYEWNGVIWVVIGEYTYIS